MIERNLKRIVRPYRWVIIISSHGMAEGRSWTRRGAELELMKTQSEWFAER